MLPPSPSMIWFSLEELQLLAVANTRSCRPSTVLFSIKISYLLVMIIIMSVMSISRTTFRYWTWNRIGPHRLLSLQFYQQLTNEVKTPRRVGLVDRSMRSCLFALFLPSIMSKQHLCSFCQTITSSSYSEAQHRPWFLAAILRGIVYRCYWSFLVSWLPDCEIFAMKKSTSRPLSTGDYFLSNINRVMGNNIPSREPEGKDNQQKPSVRPSCTQHSKAIAARWFL